MPSTRRRRKRASHAQLSPSWRHYLMCGAHDDSNIAPARLPGWLEMLTSRDEEVAAVWAQHRAELLGEARAAGFEPFGALFEREGGDADDVMPPDPARLAWSEAFCAAHKY